MIPTSVPGFAVPESVLSPMKSLSGSRLAVATGPVVLAVLDSVVPALPGKEVSEGGERTVVGWGTEDDLSLVVERCGSAVLFGRGGAVGAGGTFLTVVRGDASSGS